ncbi:RNA polymerase I-specific transcription initiation factor RRN3-like [Stegodyphus dumicola]|uniref:RNA polymerase I-specific transcription initiation factor RRN3-like n=1 Tax=Stegodyphus dumicola TaxID=202533 RepID=UPI0015B02519|nr:RNA polymerase I-specific transcription initiation factor RRN3-like [Stegodyphus dumicola]
MAMVLTPILKNTVSGNLKEISGGARVKFNLPDDQESIITYLKEPGDESYSEKLNSVIKTISSPNTDNTLLLKWIKEFKDSILFLSRENNRIISALLNLSWYLKDDSFIVLYEEFIQNLVTAHASYVGEVLFMIVKIFYTVSDVNNEDITESEMKMYQNSHKLLKLVIKLVPLSIHALCPLLTKKFPYVKTSTHILHCYIVNLLNICTYLPSKRPEILKCIFEHLINVDVNCSRENIELYEFEREQENIAFIEQGTMQESDVQKDTSMAFPLARTLDLAMNSMLTFIHKTCYPEGEELDWDATKKLYKELLAVFEKIILPTHGSCHLQYVMFYICSFKQDLCDGFLDYLWKKVQNPSIGPVHRQICAFYIGSLLARAKYINISTVTACFDLMCNWLHRYIDVHTTQDLVVHGTFHSICQTVFYVFAFRSKELLELKNGHKYMQSLNFDRIVTSRLNPLRFCDSTIVQNFANVSRNYQIAYVYPVIERNNRNLLYSCFEPSVSYTAGAMIQTFFPFDPYLLKRSKHWIEPLYRIYNHSHKDEDAMDYEDVEVPSNDDLFSYGTSPGFKKSNFLKHDKG